MTEGVKDMIIVLVVAVAVALAIGLTAGRYYAPRKRRERDARPDAVGRILLPFTGTSISRRAFDAAVLGS